MSLQVIGAGFGRTGTLSLRQALVELGFGACYHMNDIRDDPDKADDWTKAWRKEAVDWDRVFAGYRSAVDFPVSLFYRELMEKYPQAKVILTVRDPGKWYLSVWNTIWSISDAFPRWVSRFSKRAGAQIEMAFLLIWGGLFEGRFTDRQFAEGVFLRHIEAVKRQVPADRLLVFDVVEGWQPLCRFLGVPVPDKPFPRVNETAELQKMVWLVKLLAATPYLLGLLLAGVLLYLLV